MAKNRPLMQFLITDTTKSGEPTVACFTAYGMTTLSEHLLGFTDFEGGVFKVVNLAPGYIMTCGQVQ